MKKSFENINDENEMKTEYNFSGGVRGKYAAKLAEENGYLKLDPKIMEFFKKPEDINKILLAIIETTPFSKYSTLQYFEPDLYMNIIPNAKEEFVKAIMSKLQINVEGVI